MQISEREKTLEAMLFASPESVPLEKLADALGCDIPLTRNLLNRMAEAYAKNASGIQLHEVDGAYRLCTNPAYYPAVQRLLQRKTRNAFTQAMLEVLSIIAFKQPITKGAIEEIRGISSDYHVNRLVEVGMVAEKGRLDAPYKPILFGTSEDFLLFYGLKTVEELLEMCANIEIPEDEMAELAGHKASDTEPNELKENENIKEEESKNDDGRL